MTRWILALVGLGTLAAGAAGCAVNAEDEAESDEAAASADKTCTGWDDVGTGVSYKNTGDGNGVFIGYSGYKIGSTFSCAWADALHAARLKALGVGHVYAVKGPVDSGYAAREIGNSKLGSHLLAGPAARAPFILVAAHSSGAYPAHELLGQLYDAKSPADAAGATKKKIVYANLDGGGRGLDDRLVGELRRVSFVWAEDTTLAAGRSSNAGPMEQLGARFGGTALRIRIDNSGCASGEKMCVHTALITTRPQDPYKAGVASGYNFAVRPVQVEWIDALASFLK